MNGVDMFFSHSYIYLHMEENDASLQTAWELMNNVLKLLDSVEDLKNLASACPLLRAAVNKEFHRPDKVATFDIPFDYSKGLSLQQTKHVISISGCFGSIWSRPNPKVVVSEFIDNPLFMHMHNINELILQDVDTGGLVYINQLACYSDYCSIMVRKISLDENCPYNIVHLESVIIEHDESDKPPVVTLCVGLYNIHIRAMVCALSRTQTLARFSVVPAVLKLPHTVFISIEATCNPKCVRLQVCTASANNNIIKDRTEMNHEVQYISFMQERCGHRYVHSLICENGMVRRDHLYLGRIFVTTIPGIPKKKVGDLITKDELEKIMVRFVEAENSF